MPFYLFIHLLVASDAPGLRCCMYAVCVLHECSVPHVRSVCPACAYTYRSCVHAAYRTLSGIWDSVPRPGTELWAPALAEWHLSHWVTRDAPQMMGCLSFPFTLQKDTVSVLARGLAHRTPRPKDIRSSHRTPRPKDIGSHTEHHVLRTYAQATV